MQILPVDNPASAALTSWPLDGRVIAALLATAVIYLIGWIRGRRILRSEEDFPRLWAFYGGLLALFLGMESPLDAFDNLYLSAHMTQHLLLLMVAPPLLLMGHPALPFLRGLPRVFVKEGLGPFLASPFLQRAFEKLTSPPVAWLLFAVSTLGWHMPRFYELALSQPGWHALQHACFFWSGIVYWWTVVEPRRTWPRWTAIPYLLLADFVNTALSAFLIFSDRLLYPSYAGAATAAAALHDQVLAGAIMWVPGSLIYLIPAIAIAMRLLSEQRPPTPPRRRHEFIQIEPRAASMRRFRVVKLRRWAQACLLLLAVAVMADGFFGPQVGPLNLAGVLPWIYWRAFSLIALALVGNLFCLSCPFVLARDLARRALPRSLRENRLRWPRWLRNKWLAAALFALYLWAYEAFGLWDSPWLTACVIAGYFAAAILVDTVFRGASFCKYCCPIGQFHFIASLVSPRELKVRDVQVCQTCGTYDCIRGNQRARGCELYLFQPKKASNLDCTLCLDCVNACPHGNVALLPVFPASTLIEDPYRSSIGRLSKRLDFTVLALAVVFGAFVNAAAMTGPVMAREHVLHARWGPGAMPWVVAAFVAIGLLLAPGVCVLLGWLANRLAGAGSHWQRFALALVPVGIAMWLAHLFFHLASAWRQPLPILYRLAGNANASFPPGMIPDWVRPLQIVVLDGGLLLTLYVIWRIAVESQRQWGRSLAVSAPWFTMASALYCAGVWILFQPMQMRGMMH